MVERSLCMREVQVSPKKPWRTVGSCTDAKEGFKIIFILLLVQTYSSCSLQPSLASSTSLFATRSTLIRTSDSALMVLALSRASLSFGGCLLTCKLFYVWLGIGVIIPSRSCLRVLMLNGTHDRKTNGFSASCFVTAITDALNRTYGEPCNRLQNLERIPSY
ncbi:transmembrane protein, putative [Medicago truncatula]|uniref:Transmembrane protein, putative n=1 Tax=Medicago truncatula TaxID=3880 RepID=G7ILH8_MEDTR|nr:transmembrane protein, putative [Medicago truncatula]